MIANGDRGDALTHRLHNPAALMAEDAGEHAF